jgi:DNA-binding MarR family transcriptional regulator
LLALAEALAVAPSTATRICDHLVRQGLATRERDRLDRREVRLALTPKASHVISEVLHRRREALVAVIETLPPPERQWLVGTLRTIADGGQAPAPPVPLLLSLQA